MKLKTNKLLLTSLIIIGLTLLVAIFLRALGCGSKESIFLAFPVLISFGINIIGLIIGISERKKDKSLSMIGILGHSFLIITFFGLIGYLTSVPISSDDEEFKKTMKIEEIGAQSEKAEKQEA